MPQPIEDLVEIQQLYATYNHLIDAGRGAEWAALFVDVGTLDTGMGFAVEGTEQARTEFGDSVPAMMPGSRHVVSNLQISVDGDSAAAAAYLQLWGAGDEGVAKLLVSGVYEDTLRRTDQGWRFVERVLVPDAGQPVSGGVAR